MIAKAARGQALRIQINMSPVYRHKDCKFPSLALAGILVLGAILLHGSPLRAQEVSQGPMAAPPPDHHVIRITNEPEPAAPPSLPEAEIIKRLSQKEDIFLSARTHYTYRKTIRIQEFGPDGKPAGEFVVVTQPTRDVDGKFFEKVVERPHSTLQHLYLRTEDLEGLQRIPAYQLTTAQLAKYDLKFLGKEQVDEVDCYIFQTKPKMVERTKAYFDGVVWVDAKYLEVVKTYGKWVTDLGDMHPVADLPFALFETYREFVDGKYWFPDYSRSDDILNQKGMEIPVRVTIKWTDFKLATAAAAPPITPTQPPAASAKP